MPEPDISLHNTNMHTAFYPILSHFYLKDVLSTEYAAYTQAFGLHVRHRRPSVAQGVIRDKLDAASGVYWPVLCMLSVKWSASDAYKHSLQQMTQLSGHRTQARLGC